MSSQCPNNHKFYEKNELILECKECGLGKTRTKTAPCDEQNYVVDTDEERKFKLKLYRRIFYKYFDTVFKKRGRVLDVGCAGGLFLEFLKSKRWEVYGIEPFSQKSHRDITIWKACIEDFSSKLKFDLITMCAVLEHVKDPLKALTKCHELLKDEGKFYLGVANYAGWWSKITGMNWPWLNLKEHTYHYTINSLKKILVQVGFEIIFLKTSSDLSPSSSLPNVFLAEKGVFDKGLFSIWPLSPLLFRFSNWLKKPVDWIADVLLNGAEIYVVAKRI
jgi:SAM-dependent methyltransferase